MQKASGSGKHEAASDLISRRIAELGDWRGKTLGRMRRLIHEAAPDIVEETDVRAGIAFATGGIFRD